MANKFARTNGNFNDPSIWSLLPGSMSATTVPGAGDNAIANSFTIQVIGNVACDNIYNSNLGSATAGGTFNLNDGSNLAANIWGGSVTTACVQITGSNSATTIGYVDASGMVSNGTTLLVNHSNASSSLTITGGINTSIGGINPFRLILHSGVGTLNINGVVNASSMSQANATAIQLSNPQAKAVITGSILGSSSGSLGTISNTGSVVVYGTVTGGNGTQYGLTAGINGGSFIYVEGSIVGGVDGPAIQSATNTIIKGTITANNSVGAIHGNCVISGNIINAANGTQAIYAPSYRIDPVPTNSFIRYARNGTGVGSDAWLYQYTTDSLSAFSMPPVSSVRASVQFANNTLTGTCFIPSPSSVSYGTLVDGTSGTAVVSVNDLFQIFSTPLSSLTIPNTIGSRIRTAATTEATGNLIASFTNG